MPDTSSEEKVKIGGWLIVVGVVLWFGVLADSLNIFMGLIIPQPHSQLVNFILNMVLLLPMLVMFHRRKKALIWWTTIYGIYVVLDEGYIQYRHMMTAASTPIIGPVVAIILEVLLMTLVVMYFHRSKRVRDTFVR